MRTLSKQLEMLFESRNYTWKISGEDRCPSAEDIDKLLSVCQEALDNPDREGVQLEVGRLIVRKDGNHLDVYAYFGEI